MKFTKELKKYMMPLGTLSENDIVDFEKKVKDMPFSLSKILKDENIDTLIFDKVLDISKKVNNLCINR